MPSVASFMMPACKCVTACPEDKLRSVVDSLVNEKIGCVVVVDTLSRKAVGIITKQDVNRMFLAQVRPATRAKRRARSAPRDEARPTRRERRGADERPPARRKPRLSETVDPSEKKKKNKHRPAVSSSARASDGRSLLRFRRRP